MDLEKAKQEFLKYISNYDCENNIDMKIRADHSIRVMEKSKEIAQNLKLNEEQVNLATLIGLLHDIARFEQLKRYGTFKDRLSIDHGDLGVEILKTDNYIRTFIKEEKYDEIIFKAIKNHNKLEIEQGLNENELMYCKIIRDADKIDILYECEKFLWNTEDEKEQIENAIISKDAFEEFKNKIMVHHKNMKNLLDNVIGNVGFIFDINFKYSFNIIEEEDYINKILDKFDFKNEETRKQITEIRQVANKYVKEMNKIEANNN